MGLLSLTPRFSGVKKRAAEASTALAVSTAGISGELKTAEAVGLSPAPAPTPLKRGANEQGLAAAFIKFTGGKLLCGCSRFAFGPLLQGTALLVGICVCWPGSLSAQDATNSPAAAAFPRTYTSAPIPAPLSVPTAPGKSPVALFRELLAMPYTERLQSLTNRPPEARKAILAKLREYETLKPDERELRLKATELRWYLYPLLRTPATNRPALLARIPAADRKLVEDRLADWDKLTPEAQKELLQNEAVIRVLTDVTVTPNAAARPQLTEKRVQEWQALPAEQRQKLVARFDLFFKLRPEEQDKVLRTLSEAERQQIEKTLDKFQHLTPAQRRHCIHAFEKFANLSPAERQQFLKNAERWTLMTPEERQKWRELVSIAPMLPAGTDETVKAPRPFSALPRRVVPSVATNGQ